MDNDFAVTYASYLPQPPKKRMNQGLLITLVVGSVFMLTLCLMGALGSLIGRPLDAAPQTSAPVAPLVGDTAPVPSTPTAAPDPDPTSSTVAAPLVVTERVTETKAIPFSTRRVNDPNLPKGQTVVRTAGRNGVRTLTYDVTTTDGVQTSKTLVSDVVTTQPVTKVVAVGTKVTSQPKCDPNYTPCVPIASDVDCGGGGGNGPAYVWTKVRIIGNDIYDLDNDGDGYGCDSLG